MNKYITKIILYFATSILLTSAPSLALADAAHDIANIKTLLEKRTPPINAKSIQQTPLAGVYEVYFDGNIYYMDNTTTYVLYGASLLDDAARKNLTAERLKELTKINFSELPLQNAIEVKKGLGTYKFAIFTDPDCPYCKTLEKELAESKITDYTAYVFLYPLKHLHPDAAQKSEAIWCAKDKVKTWHDWMVKGSAPTKLQCENPIEANIKLAADIGVLGTPSIYLHDGVPAKNLEELTSAISANK